MLFQLASIIPEVTDAHFSLPEIEFTPTVILKLEFHTANVKKAKENSLAESITFVLNFVLVWVLVFSLKLTFLFIYAF